MAHVPENSSSHLPPGTQVGPWRVEAWQGQGAYGAVYRALRTDQENMGLGALKLARYPWDGRFGREAELLSRLSHPSIPRLLDRGLPRGASGAERPWFVMEWVEGTPLYAWAEQHAPADQQVCQLLAQLARALEAIHTAGAVHRDVKGDNVLVRHSDGRAVLVDFGSCHFPGAARLTWQSLPPGTPAYQSPQACLFELRSVRERNGYYAPSPADDLFALGVTAYRLVMGQYPPELKPHQDEEDHWHVTSPDPRPLLETNPRVEPLLREWILRLLSDEPAARGTAAQLAEALETAADKKVPQPLPKPQPAPRAVSLTAQAPAEGSVLAKHSRPRARRLVWRPWLALAAAGVSALLLWTPRQPGPDPAGHLSTNQPQASNSHAPDAGTAAVEDSTPTIPPASAQPPAVPKRVAQESPPEPRPGQLRPDAKGRCVGPMQVAINGGCWLENPSMNAEACAKGGYVFLQGKCYGPALVPPQKPRPTSSPTEAR
ncbi:MAG TPA: protein kinase [Myxococcaceae bacterium]